MIAGGARVGVGGSEATIIDILEEILSVRKIYKE
jgi:hypothetical protein